MVSKTSITLIVERPDMPRSLSFLNDVTRMDFDARGDELPLFVLAHFATADVVDVTESTRISYVSSDPRVATVGKHGRVTAVGSGRATITVRYGSLKSLPLTVRVTVP